MANCEYVRKYYGVPACIGRRVVAYGKPGIIAEDRGNYIGILLDEDKPGNINNYHPTDGIEYLDEIGKVRPMTRSMKNDAWLCPLKGQNKNSPCGGGLTHDGLCFNHSVLFDHWGCGGGYEIYELSGKASARAAFRLWHKKLSANQIKNLQDNSIIFIRR